MEINDIDFRGCRVINSQYGEGYIINSTGKTIRVAFKAKDGFFLFPNCFYSKPPCDLAFMDESSYELLVNALHDGRPSFEYQGTKYFLYSVDQPYKWKSIYGEYIKGALSESISDSHKKHLEEQSAHLALYPTVRVDGANYYLVDGIWENRHSAAVKESFGEMLTRRYNHKLVMDSISEYSTEELRKRAFRCRKTANEIKRSSSDPFRRTSESDTDEREFAQYAIDYYEALLIRIENEFSLSERAEALAYCLPSLSSCYRMMKKPKEAIRLLERYKGDSEVVFNHQLYTSIAAAYDDLDDSENALAYIQRAQALNNGILTRQMENVLMSITGTDRIDDNGGY